MRIVFAGTSAFAVPALRALADDPAFRIDLVITQPDRPTGRKQILTPPPVKVLAQERSLSVLQPENVNTELPTWLEKHPLDRPDFLVVVSYGQLISDELLAWPTVAPVNVHASLLPRWRGASPIQQTILAGDTQAGVTIQRMVKTLDAGPILAQEAIAIGNDMTAPVLHDRLTTLGAELLVRTLKEPLYETPQDETRVTFCRKLKREDGMIDPSVMTAEDIDRNVRALVPWPGVTTMIDDQPLKLLRTSLVEHPDAAPLHCATGTILYLIEVQPPGKKPMSGKAWLAGRGARA